MDALMYFFAASWSTAIVRCGPPFPPAPSNGISASLPAIIIESISTGRPDNPVDPFKLLQDYLWRGFFERADERLDKVWIGGWGLRADVGDLRGVADDGGYGVVCGSEELGDLKGDFAVA